MVYTANTQFAGRQRNAGLKRLGMYAQVCNTACEHVHCAPSTVTACNVSVYYGLVDDAHSGLQRLGLQVPG